MKSRTIANFSDRLGPADRETKKALAWNLTSGFGIVVQQDQPQSASYALVWLPYSEELVSSLAIEKEIYPSDKGRHSNTYASPGLTKGEMAVRLKVSTEAELVALNEYLFEY